MIILVMEACSLKKKKKKKNWVVSMTSLRLFSMWPIRGLCISLMSKSRILFIHNLFSAIIPGNFLEMIMLIS